MPSRAHEVLLALVADEPALLIELVAHLLGKTITLPPGPADSTVRAALAAEVRPDLLFVEVGRAWTGLEVQRGVDHDKRRRWALLMGILLDRHRVLGDLFVLTAAPHVGRWARTVVHVVAPAGTRLRLTPVVIALYGRNVAKLLDARRPRLAFFAAWSMHERHGPQARHVVLRALAIASTLPEPLRTRHVRGILHVLSDRLRRLLAETTMLDIDQELDRLEPPWMRAWRLKQEARGEVKGKREALRAVLQARGLALQAPDRARVDACRDLATLDRWIARAVRAASLDEVLGPAPAPAPAKRVARPGGRAKKAPSRR